MRIIEAKIRFKTQSWPHTLQRTAQTLWRPDCTETCAKGSHRVNEGSTKKVFIAEELLKLVSRNWPVQTPNIQPSFHAADGLKHVHAPVFQKVTTTAQAV